MHTETHLLQDGNNPEKNNLMPRPPLDRKISAIDPTVMAAIQKRIAAFRKKWPHGEPLFKRFEGWRTFIYPEDIMRMHGVSLRSAQRILKNVRFLLEKKRNSEVTVTEYCTANDLNEDDIRTALRKFDDEKRKDMEV